VRTDAEALGRTITDTLDQKTGAMNGIDIVMTIGRVETTETDATADLDVPPLRTLMTFHPTSPPDPLQKVDRCSRPFG